MKFATCLALTAVAIASATADDCAFLCPLVHDPVGDENGNMYSNECFMMLAKCQAGKATASPVTSHSGSSSVEAGNNCPDLCTDEFKPVTDEHGNLYSNECYMRQAKCQDKKTGNNNPAVDPALTLRNID
ncbi:transmembrane protein with EGF-like and two follistatin-like domains 1 [Phytophthora boehmeriae]|uniref:Transmembrane protein with EGF-like and two follistatin-like domains 1 n=1 Tax=Phytophthora boehmeriae TaxID=109152 RepID=A0A8T1X427_9STRA|nr:transmembrane protein with EGF-like and two follistatin-like domains 1 [Phytophthora boehmeriae]